MPLLRRTGGKTAFAGIQDEHARHHRVLFSFFIPIVGLICSILGRKNAAECGGNGHGLATAGIVISVVWMILALLLGVIAGCSVAMAV